MTSQHKGERLMQLHSTHHTANRPRKMIRRRVEIDRLTIPTLLPLHRTAPCKKKDPYERGHCAIHRLLVTEFLFRHHHRCPNNEISREKTSTSQHCSLFVIRQPLHFPLFVEHQESSLFQR